MGNPLHIPRVRLVTIRPDAMGVVRAIFNSVYVDGEEWAIVDYHVKGSVDGIQQVTLTFLADVTIEHKEDVRRG